MAENMRIVRRCLRALTMGLPLMLVVAGAAVGAPGDLDPTFGRGGRVFINMDANAEAAASLVQQGDGKLLLGRATNFMVATNSDLSIARLNSNGTVDTGFGGYGMASTDLPGITASTKVVVIQGSDKIVVAGPAWRDDNPGREFFAIARYRMDGTLDATFGVGGYVLEDFGATNASVGALVAQPDGRLVVVGTADTSGGADMAFVRFNENGSIDETFGSKGRQIVDVEGAGRADTAYALARHSDGGLIAAGVAGTSDRPHPFLLTLTANGKVDSSFGTGGRVITDIVGGQTIGSAHLGLQSDGKVVLAAVVTRTGESSCDLRITRVDQGGQVDPTFGKSGVATLPLRMCYSENDVIVMSDDRILFVGATEFVGLWDYGGVACPCAPRVIRMTANGALDDAFGIGGEAIIDLGVDSQASNVDPAFFLGTHLVEQVDGKIMLATTGLYDDEHSLLNGEAWFHSGIAVARLLKSGASPGLIGFKHPVETVPESQGSAILHVQRTGGATGIVSVQFETSDDTARSGSDFARSSGTLTWADGDTADKAITITITDDSQVEGLEQLRVALSNPTGGANLAMSLSGLLIKDNEPTLATAPAPSLPPGPLSGSPSSGGGGTMDWMQIFALALVLVASRRRDPFTNPRP